ncbi:O-antigen ligase family protein [Mesobacillus jeotgali]|uniref:O-antigen ligase family protein n=1 Tax=Mesobacillus jeotgali TaxID=129985 RepID=UPI0019F58F40|nr:O-antigen ligase family protein [Mesobacillus jeotgali]UYZ21795.1 O-antigen ligase family protein [Mesobacillus jeotgali]
MYISKSEKNLDIKFISLFQCFNVVAIAVSVSASSLLILLVIYGLSVIMEIKNPVKFILLFFISIVVFFFLMKFTTFFSSLERIGNEINASGTSGYERINSPWQYVVSTFNYFPFLGRGLGQEGNVDPIGVIGLYEGVHNSLFGIFVSFGLSALVYIIYFIYYFVRKIKMDIDFLILMVALLGIYASTGAYLSLDTFVVLVLVLFIGDLTKNSRFIINKGDN